MTRLFLGSLALFIRYALIAAGGALAMGGLVTQTGPQHFCVDARILADGTATAIGLYFGGGASVAVGVAWRWWARKRGGVT